MRLRSLGILPLLAASAFALHCGGATTNPGNPLPDGGNAGDGGIVTADAAPEPDGNPDAVGATTASKVDILLVVDDSASMLDKTRRLAASLGTLVRGVAPAADVHLGVISTSLGAMGGDACDPTTQSRGGRLSTVGADGQPVPAATSGFLTLAKGGDVDAFLTNAQELVRGVGERGCGLEAQLESAYHFLVAPDPWERVNVDANGQAEYVGTDGALLAQRAAFLRPDSLVAIVLLTDEDDSSPDPLAIGGQGWAFGATKFPGSTVFRADGRSTTAPRATSACLTNPGSPDCTSCGFGATCEASDPACQKIKSDPECQKNGGYYGPNEDSLNVRFHRMKERYGVDPQFPISRYVDALTKQRVPNKASEHPTKAGPGGSREIGAYSGTATCTNPLFAASLPTSATDDLCNRAVGPRGKDLVLFAVIGGVPSTLVSAAGEATSWNAVLGADPGSFDFSGIDPHMVQSTVPRAGLPGPSSTPGDNGTDPVHGREWTTNGEDLQYACTYALAEPQSCGAADAACECGRDLNVPLCGTGATQIRGKAYPSVRELRVARALGDRAVIGSICAAGAGGATAPHDATMSVLVNKIAARLVP